MPAEILSGNKIRDERLVLLAKIFSNIKPTPELAIIQVGDRPDSTSYIGAKIDFAKKLGVVVRHIHMPINVDQIKVIEEIKKCNSDTGVRGIIVQLPLPANIDRDAVISAIDPEKDIDGLTPTNVYLLSIDDQNAIIPATARGVIELLSYYKIPLQEKKITVIGRSALVGRPIAQLLSNMGSVVTVAHSKTEDLVKETQEADIVIVAVGKSRLIGPKHVHRGQVIIDVGINRDGEVDIKTGRSRLIGDVDFEAVSHIIGSSGAISPVPGGVGPMTVLSLFENLADASL